MSKRVSKLIQYILFPAIGIYIIWDLYKGQKVEEIVTMLRHGMDYSWIGLSLIFGLLSHVSRAMRWQMLLQPVERKPGLTNSFLAVMVGYLFNLVFPRMGEVTKCGVLSKYEHLSFTRVMGTVVAERLADLFVLIVIVVSVLTLQFEFLSGFLANALNLGLLQNILASPVLYVLLVLTLVLLFYFRKFLRQFTELKHVRLLVSKFTEGINSIRKIKNKPLFIVHTLFIWSMYFLMVYVCFYSMPVTSSLGIDAGITILLTGSLGMIAPVQGGIGAWHFMVIGTLKLYGINADEGGIFALVVHASQNLMIIVVGLIAFGLLPIINRSENGSATGALAVNK